MHIVISHTAATAGPCWKRTVSIFTFCLSGPQRKPPFRLLDRLARSCFTRPWIAQGATRSKSRVHVWQNCARSDAERSSSIEEFCEGQSLAWCQLPSQSRRAQLCPHTGCLLSSVRCQPNITSAS